MKLIYLADIEWAQTHGNTPYTEAKYYRWNHGPFSREVLQALDENIQALVLNQRDNRVPVATIRQWHETLISLVEDAAERFAAQL